MKKIISILICMIISCMFCIFMGITFSSLLKGDVSANLKESQVESIKNINVKNFDKKIRDLKSVKKNKLKYSNSLSECKGEKTYLDKEYSVYKYDNDKLVAYSMHIDPENTSNEIILREDAINYAEQYLNKMVEQPDVYRLDSVVYDKYLNEYCIGYMHYINNVKSTDIVYMEIGAGGVLNGFNIHNHRKFDDIIIKAEDIDFAKEIAVKELRAGCSYDISKINFVDVVISINDDGNFALLLTADFEAMVNNKKWQGNDTFEIPINNILVSKGKE